MFLTLSRENLQGGSLCCLNFTKDHAITPSSVQILPAMKVFSILTAFLSTSNHHRHPDVRSLQAARTEVEDCIIIPLRRRLLERSVNNKQYLGLEHPVLHPGDEVKQKSLLLDPVTKQEVGTVHTLATVLDPDVRLAHGAYNITVGPRIGLINFSALIPNYLATKEFDMTITGGTGDFHSAQGWIIVSNPEEVEGALERDATFHICGLYQM